MTTTKVIRIAVAALSLSATGLVGIISHEGYREIAYKDIVGVPTIGFGTTEGVNLGDKTTPVKAIHRALSDVHKFEGALRKCVKVPLSQGEYDAYISLSYNIGASAFCKSTLVKKLNTGDYQGACNEILRWNRAGGKVIRGLTTRRQDEYIRCTSD